MKNTRTRPLLAALAATAVVAGGVVTSVAAAPSAEAAPATIRVITHNLEKKDAALDTVIALAGRTTGPEVLLLQEVCGDMLTKISNLGFTVTFHPRRATKCAGGDPRLGEATVWTGPGAKEFGPVALLDKGDHSYGMACLDLRHSGEQIRACSTHLIAGRTKEAPFRGRLTAKIRTITSGWISSTRTVIVGGDFNTNPTYDAMDAIYGVGPSAKGKFREIAQIAGSGNEKRAGLWTSGRTTDERDTRRKIDYIFVSKVGSRPQGGSERAMSSASNHRILYGLVPLG